MAEDDIQIKIGEAVRRHIERRLSPLGDSAKTVVPYDSPDADPIPVFMSEEVMKAIERQTLANKEQEVGGIMLGGFYRNDDGSFVEVTDLVEAENTKGTDVSLTFTHETWERIHERIGQRGNDLQMVGWYHSHPGLGVFMSKEDEFIHTSYFPDPWHIAIVHDPIYTNWGCFKWGDGRLDRTGGFYVFAEKKQSRRVREYIKSQMARRQAAPRSASSDADRLARPSSPKAYSVWAAILVMLLIQLGIGWQVMSRNAPAPKTNDYKTAVQLLRISDLSGAETYLRKELSTHPGNEEAYRELRALNRVLENASITNAAFDRENLMLSAGSKIAAKGSATGKPVSPTASTPATLDDHKDETVNADYAGHDPMDDVLAEYESAAASRVARIARAKTVSSLVKTRWSRDAVEWLENEELRQIAYGKVAVPTKYSTRYKGLSAAEKKAVDRVLQGKK